MKTEKIAIIGAGNMGTSIIRGLIAQGYPADQLWATNTSIEKLQQCQTQFGIHVTQDNKEAAQSADIILLAVKPQIFPKVVPELAPLIQKHRPLIISIAAGIRESSLQQGLGGNIAIIRCMPNTPAMIGCGALALYANTLVTKTQRENAEQLLQNLGPIFWLENEDLMDAVMAISACGPAYFFLIIEALQAAGEQLGVPKEMAQQLSLQTAYGAVRMMQMSSESPAQLRKNVASPGGTTEQALRVLEEKNIRQIFLDAVQAAKHRSEELATTFGKKLEMN
jgi:pyrroline-5-carboxylate reductase